MAEQGGIALAMIFPLVFGMVYSTARSSPTDIVTMAFPLVVLILFLVGFVKLK